MDSELLAAAAAAAAPPSKRPSISSAANATAITTTITSAADGTTTTTTTTTKRSKTTSAADGTTSITITATTTIATTSTSIATATTISSLGQDQLLEIFLRLPDLPALVRAALTCRSWLGAVRSSPSFRRLFRELHPAPLIGLFLDIDGAATPSFVPLRRSDPEVTAALRRGDFFLTSLPVNDDVYTGWGYTDCRDGYVLLWNKIHKPSVAAVNPMTWAVDTIPLPRDVESGSGRDFAFLGFYLLSSDETPWSVRVVCVCADDRRVRVAIFSSEKRDWVVHRWMYIGGDNSLKYGAGTLVDGSVYWPLHGEGRMIRINTATMDISFMDLPSQMEVAGSNFMAGETKDGQLCIVYESDFSLYVWIHSVDADGTEAWVLHNMISLSEEIDELTRNFYLDFPVNLNIVQVRSGYVYLSAICTPLIGTLRCWSFSLSLETMELELLVEGNFGGRVYPYFMAWPPSLVGDDGSTGNEVEGGSH